VIAGTPPFMSPEQARGESMRSHSDLFSLGSVLYAMATGRPPYRGASPLAVIRQIGEQPPTPISELNERMPVWFETLVNRLMRRSPEDRPQSAEEVGAILLGCLSHVRSGGRDALPDAVLAEPHAASRASLVGRRVALVLSLIAVVGLFTVAVMMVPGIVSPDRVESSTAKIPSTPLRPANSPADRVTASAPAKDTDIESQAPSPFPSEARSGDAIVEPQTESALPEIDSALWQVNGEIEQLRQAILSDLGTLEPDKESSDDE
jgi:serine/threonine-protein kinase